MSKLSSIIDETAFPTAIGFFLLQSVTQMNSAGIIPNAKKKSVSSKTSRMKKGDVEFSH